METDMLAILLNLTVGALFGLMTYQVNKAISFVKGGLSKISENRITTLVGGATGRKLPIRHSPGERASRRGRKRPRPYFSCPDGRGLRSSRRG